ncbi:hypothetical protein STURON_00329 [Spiroplasma turonicum]|uniref:Uncharacterized protein n=1 Tax=Spiroplasma turonicum TaxID=216946 RepID=A0A0K1P5P7_9MOLU|nr:hypothetical protein STURON_00329 [Spiroplasma turonicum]
MIKQVPYINVKNINHILLIFIKLFEILIIELLLIKTINIINSCITKIKVKRAIKVLFFIKRIRFIANNKKKDFLICVFII